MGLYPKNLRNYSKQEGLNTTKNQNLTQGVKMLAGDEREFKKKLTGLVNECSLENHSNTPDWVIAEYLTKCLMIFDSAIIDRKNWFGDKYEKTDDWPLD